MQNSVFNDKYIHGKFYTKSTFYVNLQFKNTFIDSQTYLDGPCWNQIDSINLVEIIVAQTSQTKLKLQTNSYRSNKSYDTEKVYPNIVSAKRTLF